MLPFTFRLIPPLWTAKLPPVEDLLGTTVCCCIESGLTLATGETHSDSRAPTLLAERQHACVSEKHSLCTCNDGHSCCQAHHGHQQRRGGLPVSGSRGGFHRSFRTSRRRVVLHRLDVAPLDAQPLRPASLNCRGQVWRLSVSQRGCLLIGMAPAVTCKILSIAFMYT